MELSISLSDRDVVDAGVTERGEVFLHSCRQVLEDIEQAERRAQGEDAEPRGSLKVAAPILFGRLHVLPIVSRVLTKHPGLTVHLTLSDRNVHLAEESVDVAVRVGDLADSSMKAIRLGSVSQVLVASPGYLARRGTPKTPKDLPAHDVIAFESLDTTNEWRFGPAGKLVRVEPRLTVNSADAAIAAAEAGLGISRTLSYQVRASVLAGRLVPLLVGFTAGKLPVSAIYPARRMASANLGAFIENARNYFKETLSSRSRNGQSRRTKAIQEGKRPRSPPCTHGHGRLAQPVTGDFRRRQAADPAMRR
ncbi:LysR substrate-binding domain-containing protein [Lichenifustis flavocetrariae]|uniref:LysR substrate-binding domain-containing protein n=1 Tax=Lichenifustis flavocetrariae TaxID=2949735 RepID=A0AA42CJJ4_9HYPH|nr:LysR substrate-binding domain-containing protein [Lichenifustis flavocetrariae]MCW6509633.1 LysR substrate-binding domain-containing protein [Lichenifustis flavocetrariae]